MKPSTLADLDADLIRAIESGVTQRIMGACRAMDEWQQRHSKPPVTTLSAALYYAQQGLHVFPLQPRAKVPHKGTRGCLEATDDPDTIRAWWNRWPESNVAIATGHLVDVIDIDGTVGQISLARNLLDDSGLFDQGETPMLGKVSTPRPGGTHLYVPAVPGRTNKAALFPGIDTRGAGGYVVAPPSSNEAGKAYEWIVPLDLVAAT